MAVGFWRMTNQHAFSLFHYKKRFVCFTLSILGFVLYISTRSYNYLEQSASLIFRLPPQSLFLPTSTNQKVKKNLSQYSNIYIYAHTFFFSRKAVIKLAIDNNHSQQRQGIRIPTSCVKHNPFLWLCHSDNDTKLLTSGLREGRITISCKACLASSCPAISSNLTAGPLTKKWNTN